MLQKINDYKQLMKFNLSLLVVFSCVVGYVIVPDLKIDFWKLLELILGGFLVTAAANATNEIIEIETDKIMKRTQGRPLPASRMSMLEGILFVIITLVIGLWILQYYFNVLTAIISFISYVLYSFVYTPLKRISSISVLVGAIPGSLPCLIGWVAATNHLGSVGAWTLFIIQFFWQFPHFWSIAWIAHEDYEKAGMKMLPREGKVGHYTALQCVLYSSVLIPLSVLPQLAGLGGWISFTGLLVGAIWMLYNSINFLKDNSDAKARRVMFSSFIYLPLVLIAMVIDKFV